MNMVGKQNKSANAKWVVSSHMQKCLFYQRRVCFVTQNLIPPIRLMLGFVPQPNLPD